MSGQLPKVLEGEFPNGLECAGCQQKIGVGEWYTSRLGVATETEAPDASAGGAADEAPAEVVELVCRACGMPEDDG